MEGTDWYQGTADAVRKHLDDIKSIDAKDVLILAGDHLYRMDYSKMIRHHRAEGADVTVAVKPVSRRDTSRFGILKMTSRGHIDKFVEALDRLGSDRSASVLQAKTSFGAAMLSEDLAPALKFTHHQILLT